MPAKLVKVTADGKDHLVITRVARKYHSYLRQEEYQRWTQTAILDKAQADYERERDQEEIARSIKRVRKPGKRGPYAKTLARANSPEFHQEMLRQAFQRFWNDQATEEDIELLVAERDKPSELKEALKRNSELIEQFRATGLPWTPEAYMAWRKEQVQNV